MDTDEFLEDVNSIMAIYTSNNDPNLCCQKYILMLFDVFAFLLIPPMTSIFDALLRARGDVLVGLDPLLQRSDAVADAAAQLVVRGAVAVEARFSEPALAELQIGRSIIGRQERIGMVSF